MNTYFITCNGAEKKISILDETYALIDGKKISYELHEITRHFFILRLGNNVYNITKVSNHQNRSSILIDGFYFDTTVQSELEKRASEIVKKHQKTGHHEEVKSPMPGLVLKCFKKVGDSVDIGEPVLILEAMKMENVIKSPNSGTLKNIYVNEQQPIEKGARLFQIDP